MSSMNEHQPDNYDFAITRQAVKYKIVETVTPAVLLILTLMSKGHSWMHRDLHTYVMTQNFGSSDKLLGGISWVTYSSFLSAAIQGNIMNVLEGPTGNFMLFHLSVTLSNFCLQIPYPLGNISQTQKEQYLGKEKNCYSLITLWRIFHEQCNGLAALLVCSKMMLFMCSCSFLPAHWCCTLLPCWREQKYPAIFKSKA